MVKVLAHGNYLVEAMFPQLIEDLETCRNALSKMGWTGGPGEKYPIIDESPRRSSTLLRFIGHVPEGRRLELSDGGIVRWNLVHQLVIDPWADLRRNVVGFKLFTGETSEVRFISRQKIRDRERLARDVVEEDLKAWGFEVHKLAAIRQHMRLEGRPNVSQTLWIAIATWTGAASVVLGSDPFFVDDMAPIAWPEAPVVVQPGEDLSLPIDLSSAQLDMRLVGEAP